MTKSKSFAFGPGCIRMKYQQQAGRDGGKAKELKLKLSRLCTSNKVMKVLITSTTRGLIIY